MRCLYCGKELALLKRWTGGGEFCSDAHRQRYQEEYNQLALNRLLQAKPPAKPNEAPQANDAKPAKPVPAAVEPAKEAAPFSTPRVSGPESPALKVSERTRTKPAYSEQSSPAAIRETPADPPPAVHEPVVPVAVAPAPVEPLAVEAEPIDEPVHDEPAPAEAAGFLVEMPVAALAEVAPMSRPDLDFLNAVAAALPNRVFEPLNLGRDTYQLETAGLLTFEPSNRASNYTATGSRERRLEVRDFVRSAPVVEIDLSPAGETGLETSSEPMDILIFPQPPQGLPVLWQVPPVGFSENGTELGALARLAFPTTGFSSDEPSGEVDGNSAVALADAPESPVAVAAGPEPIPEVIPEVVKAAAPSVRERISEQRAESLPEAVIEQPRVQPVIQRPVVQQPRVEQPRIQRPRAVQPPPPPPVAEPGPVAEHVAEPVPAPLPELITKPLPLVLHVAAPGKGKPLQVFSAAANAVEAQVPRSTSLPLRAVMTFGPAPASVKPTPASVRNDTKNDAKTEPKKPMPAPVRPDPRVAAMKLRGGAPEVQEDSKSAVKVPVPEPAKEPAPVQAMKQVAKAETPAARPPIKINGRQDKKPEAKETVKVKEEVKPATVLPAPLAAPYPGSNDLGLPRLNLQSSSGFLGQLPAIAKIGIVVALLAGLGGLIAFSSKSGGAATTGTPGEIVAGSALPAGESGWITDWGADPGVRRTRQISILRSSQTLTDYRIEMEGQIESKAIGWVFRAADPKNFYVTKLEIVKPGLEPTVALVRFAIINGEEQAHAQLPLPMKVRLDTMYKIRFDAVGDHFSTYVQDQKVDDWTDARVKTGGVGFYRERGEDATLKGGMNVVPLIVRK